MTPAAESSAPPEPPLDRTISPIAGRVRGRGRTLGLAALLLGGAVIGVAAWRGEAPDAPKAPQAVARQVVPFEPAPTPNTPTPGPGEPPPTGQPSEIPTLASDPAGAGTGGEIVSSPGHGGMLVYARDGRPPAETPQMVPASESRTPVRLARAVGTTAAHRLGDRRFLILAGATIPCTLRTAIDTSTPGLVTCLIGRDVYSDDGAVVLMDKGSRVLGEYRGGLKRGQRRLHVLWTRAVTPDGVAVDLASPASDPLGRAGFEGEIDTRFWERFGAALMFTVLDGAGATIVDGRSGGGVTRLPADTAGDALADGLEVAPVLRKPAGAEVAIQVAQDLDFSAVYSLASLP